jgi:hypothetical protein
MKGRQEENSAKQIRREQKTQYRKSRLTLAILSGVKWKILREVDAIDR